METVNKITIRDIDLPDKPGPRDVRIKPLRVGICGSDVHYYLHGKIGSFIVNEPMVLGHEMSGVVAEVGSEVKSLKKGDRVCAEPGIPDLNSAEYRKGMYNLDPAVRFWATPPIHGCLCEEVIHPEQFTYKLPDNVSLEEGALVEPLAIGVHSAIAWLNASKCQCHQSYRPQSRTNRSACFTFQISWLSNAFNAFAIKYRVAILSSRQPQSKS